jgi:endo-beta-N-acetylglucosaminidase D
MIPTAWWMNVCHRNGVPILGTIFGHYTQQGTLDDVELLVNGSPGEPTVISPNGTEVPYFVDKLLRVAAYYGFDGSFFNMEIQLYTESQNSKLAHQMCAFVQSLTANMAQYAPQR